MTSFPQQKVQPRATFMVYYQGCLAVAASILFFTRMDVYLEGRGIGIPLYWIILFLVASIPLCVSLLSRLNSISKPILIWSGIYMALPLILIVVSPQVPDLQLLEDLIRTMLFVVLMVAIFSYHPLVSKWVKLTILLITSLNICMFVYEFLNPLAFYVEQRAPGRSSGFYDDSNTATMAVIMGMIITIDLIKPKYRLLYALFVFLGTAPTFSRGGIVGWVLVVAYFIYKKVIPRYQLPVLFLSFFMIISVLSTQLNSLQYLKSGDGTSLFQEDTLARVEFLINPFGQKDDSQAARLSYVDEAKQKFADHPFLGNGLGSGRSRSYRTPDGTAGERSHNTYLDRMVEFGFLGALIYPALLFAAVWQAQGEFKKQAIAFVLFMLIQGFFSHTLLTENCSLIAYVIMSHFAQKSYWESSQQRDQKCMV